MPQYELDAVGPRNVFACVRGRTPEEAIRRAVEVAEGAAVEVEGEADLHGWQTVRIDGEASGRVRLHQRMRFRRD